MQINTKQRRLTLTKRERDLIEQARELLVGVAKACPLVNLTSMTTTCGAAARAIEAALADYDVHCCDKKPKNDASK